MYRKELLNSVIEQKFDEELFLVIAQELIKELELTEYVKNIFFSEISEKRFDGSYDGDDIKINKVKKEGSMLFHYGKLFNILFHELEHVKERKLIRKYHEYYCKLSDNHVYTLEERKELVKIHAIGQSYISIKNKRTKYKLNHDLFPTEHAANYYGFANSIDFLVDMLPDFEKELIKPNKYSLKMLELLLTGYKLKKLTAKISSPVEQILVKDIDPYIKQLLLSYNDLSNYERMVLGLPIDTDLFIKLYNQIVDNNLPTDIKEYVLKI